jgi:subfamily B ATP-binding cassette protein MsbA
MADRPKLQLSTAWRESRDLIWARRGRLGLGFVLMAVNRLAGLVLPGTSKILVDDVVGHHRGDLLWPLAAAAAAATLVQAATGFALSQVLGLAAQRSITDMRREVEQHVARLPVAYFDSTKTGVLISRIMSDADGIRNLVGNGLVQLVGSVITAIAALGVLFWLNWSLTTITLLLLASFGAIMARAFMRLRPVFRERGKISAEVTGRLGETLGGIRIVKAYTAERREALIFAKGVHRLYRNVAKSMVGVSAVSAVSTVIVGAIGALMIVVGGRAILAGQMTLGDFFMYIFFTGLVAAPVVQIASIGTQVSEAFAGLDRIREVRSMATEDDEDRARDPIEHVEGEVVFDEVSFSYTPGVPVLKNVSFRAPAGTTTALVGSSGSGKSTLISLVMAFNRPETGAIRIDGRDLGGLRLRDYRSQLGIVLQDNFLFDGTVADNIGFSRPGAARAEIEEVGRLAHVDEFVRGFEQGYDTIVGERGVKVSGGSARNAIARAILADPRILILDHSSLDSESEALTGRPAAPASGAHDLVIAHRNPPSAAPIRSRCRARGSSSGESRTLMALGGRYHSSTIAVTGSATGSSTREDFRRSLNTMPAPPRDPAAACKVNGRNQVRPKLSAASYRRT